MTTAALSGLPARRGAVVVRFEPALPGKPLDETVWDNAVGPFWDAAESHRIGFDQHYRPQFYAIPVAGLPVFAQSAALLVDSRIVIPFGRVFSDDFTNAAKQSWSACGVCFREPCEVGNPQAVTPALILDLRVDQFVVWEAPLNHLNMYVRGQVRPSRPEGPVLEAVPFERALLGQDLGSIFTTHSAIIRRMNDVSNDLANDVIGEILQRLT